MRIRNIIAYKIWQIRQEIGTAGSNTHDWYLAEQFLQTNPDRYDDDDIYVWFVQLEENMISEKRLDNYPEI